MEQERFRPGDKIRPRLKYIKSDEPWVKTFLPYAVVTDVGSSGSIKTERYDKYALSYYFERYEGQEPDTEELFSIIEENIKKIESGNKALQAR